MFKDSVHPPLDVTAVAIMGERSNEIYVALTIKGTNKGVGSFTEKGVYGGKRVLITSRAGDPPILEKVFNIVQSRDGAGGGSSRNDPVPPVVAPPGDNYYPKTSFPLFYMAPPPPPLNDTPPSLSLHAPLSPFPDNTNPCLFFSTTTCTTLHCTALHYTALLHCTTVAASSNDNPPPFPPPS